MAEDDLGTLCPGGGMLVVPYSPEKVDVEDQHVRSFLRPLIKPFLEEGHIRLEIEWIVTGPGNELGKDPETGAMAVRHRETCRIGISREGMGYVSEVGVPDNSAAHAGLGAFFVDAEGMRHFIVQADPFHFEADAIPLG